MAYSSPPVSPGRLVVGSTWRVRRGLHQVEDPQHSVIALAARRTNGDDAYTPEQLAWIRRVELLGMGRVSAAFKPQKLNEIAANLIRRIESPHDLHYLGNWLEPCGVALVIELPLRNSKMDGIVSIATGTPTIGLSTRGDRMDGFVFTLLHEIAHLVLGHLDAATITVDEDLDPNDASEIELAANEQAARWIFPTPIELPAGELTMRTLSDVARDQGVHVAFVIGHLQNAGRLDWKAYRRGIPKVRPFVKVG